MTDSYDRVPYTSYVYAYTHPDTLCVLGRLFGLSPASPRRCRVLELGCASGGNLLPMAELLPDSEFVGLDRSRVQIDRGRALLGELGLGTVRIEHADILTVDPIALGTFDYVICHGVFAWVPRPVQDRILALTAAVLRPEGLAFISYNVYPGWHMREGVRDMMLFHTRDTASEQRVDQARALIDFLAATAAERASERDPYAQLLARELQLVRAMPDAYLAHEHLERDNSPLYFHEFCSRLGGYPLRYLCDTDLHSMVTRDLSESVRATLGRIADDQISMEQYLDFVRNREFRTSVLCRIEAKPQRRLRPDAATRLRFGMSGKPTADASLDPGVELSFVSSSGAQISSAAPLSKAALLELCERWPASVEFERLFELALARVQAAGVALAEPSRAQLGADLIECLLRKAVTARAHEPPLAERMPTRPCVPRFSRMVAAREGWVATLHHRRGTLEAPLRPLIPLLDGTRDRGQLLAAIASLTDEGELTFHDEQNEIMRSGEALTQAQSTFLDHTLTTLLGLPLLLAE
ncbi:MAG TPA: methyltransferase regulatory domain-containing protein [Enhygromyxa sp.]|nr:methyltransferase regulatory domain-containing protein [Enhygromyxa sp.]